MNRVTAVVVLAFGLMAGGVGTPSPVAAYQPLTDEYVAIPAVRVTDTRAGFPIDDQGPNPKGELGDGAVLRIPVAGRAGVPKDATAVAVNLTAPRPTTPGYLTVFACDAPQPSTSNLNLQVGNTVANIAFSKIGTSGDICVFARGTSHAIVDVVGYVPSDGSPILVAPKRVTDTRAGFPIDDQGPNPKGEPADGTVLRIPIRGRAGVPTDASGVVLNVTAPNSSSPGFLSVYACDSQRPTTSSLNLQVGATVANAVLTSIGDAGDVCVFVRGTTNVIVDVMGFVPKDAYPSLWLPKRVADTRADFPIDDQGPNPKGERTDGTVLRVPIAGRIGTPTSAGAAVLNVTAPRATSPGYLTVYACDTRQPSTSNLNLQPGRTVANTVITSIGPKGDVCIFTRGTTNIIVDVTGYTFQPRPVETSCTIGGTAVKTAIPQTECDALVAIYNTNNGPNWRARDGWNTATDPCTWYGVRCENGTVTELQLPSNKLTGALSGQIGTLGGLNIVDLQGNSLTGIPSEIGMLTNLRDLSLNSNTVTELPAQIGNLTKLQFLNVSDNPIANMTPQIGRLTNLTQLKFARTEISNVPAEIGNLTKLYELDLAETRITSLPTEIGRLSNVNVLALSGNDLTTLPPEIGNLTNLVSLSLAGNQLTSLPPEIGKLDSLRFLRVSDNELTSVPVEIGYLDQLRELELDGNRLTTVPLEMGLFIDLRILNLSRNRITDLPTELGNISNLEAIDLEQNQLTTVPLFIGRLQRLTDINLRSNIISGDVSAAFSPLVSVNRVRSVLLSGNICPVASDPAVDAWLRSVSPGWGSCLIPD